MMVPTQSCSSSLCFSMDVVPNSSPSMMDVVSESKSCLFDRLPDEMSLEIFSFCKGSLLVLLSLIGEPKKNEGKEYRWKVLVDDYLRPFVLRNYAFGSEQWSTFFNLSVDESFASSLPLDIAQILCRPCKAFPGKSIADTHYLVWIPKTIDGQPLTLRALDRIPPKEFPCISIAYLDLWREIMRKHGDVPNDASHWVLITKNLLKSTIRKDFNNIELDVANLAEEGQLAYEVAKVLDLAICIFAKFYSTESQFFCGESYPASRCQEIVNGHQLCIGPLSDYTNEVTGEKGVILTSGITTTGVVAQVRFYSNKTVEGDVSQGIVNIYMGDNAMPRVAL